MRQPASESIFPAVRASFRFVAGVILTIAIETGDFGDDFAVLLTFDEARALIFRSRGLRRSQSKRRQDEQDLQDGFCLRPTGAMHLFQLNPVNGSIL